jgi:hypothetical protein
MSTTAAGAATGDAPKEDRHQIETFDGSDRVAVTGEMQARMARLAAEGKAVVRVWFGHGNLGRDEKRARFWYGAVQYIDAEAAFPLPDAEAA